MQTLSTRRIVALLFAAGAGFAAVPASAESPSVHLQIGGGYHPYHVQPVQPIYQAHPIYQAQPIYQTHPGYQNGHHWVPGHWQWNGHGRAWVPGHWVTAQHGYAGRRHEGRRDRDRDGIPDRHDRDLDNDGRPNHRDWDRDGDGVPNRQDRRPDNRYRY